MIGYTKLFGSIVASTIWREDNETRIVWITMLALKTRDHTVQASIPGLAVFAGVSISGCQRALAKLSAPDEFSRTQENEGRRIVAIDGGWKILNGEKYRQKMNSDDRREYLREKQAEWRKNHPKRNDEVNNSKLGSTSSTHTEEDTEAKADTDTESQTKAEAESLITQLNRNLARTIGNKYPRRKPEAKHANYDAAFTALNAWSEREGTGLEKPIPLGKREANKINAMLTDLDEFNQSAKVAESVEDLNDGMTEFRSLDYAIACVKNRLEDWR